MAISWDGVAWAPSTAYALNARATHNVDAAWAPTTAYLVGALVANGGNQYKCTTAGTSAGAGGPTGVGTAIVDGGCVWTFVAPEVLSVYQCVTAGTSGAAGPTGTTTAIADGSVVWSYLGAYTGNVLDVAPELASGANPIGFTAQTLFLNLAEQLVANNVSQEAWGTLLDDGRRHMAAHLGQLSRLRGHGPITAEDVGPLSRSYASMISPQAIELTPAGRGYMDLVRTLGVVFGFTG